MLPGNVDRSSRRASGQCRRERNSVNNVNCRSRRRRTTSTCQDRRRRQKYQLNRVTRSHRNSTRSNERRSYLRGVITRRNCRQRSTRVTGRRTSTSRTTRNASRRRNNYLSVTRGPTTRRSTCRRRHRNRNRSRENNTITRPVRTNSRVSRMKVSKSLNCLMTRGNRRTRSRRPIINGRLNSVATLHLIFHHLLILSFQRVSAKRRRNSNGRRGTRSNVECSRVTTLLHIVRRRLASTRNNGSTTRAVRQLQRIRSTNDNLPNARFNGM